MPLPDGKGAISIKWEKTAKGIQYTIQTPEPIYLHTDLSNLSKSKRVDKTYTMYDIDT